MDGRTEVERDSKKTNIAKSEKDVVEGHGRPRRKVMQHIQEDLK